MRAFYGGAGGGQGSRLTGTMGAGGSLARDSEGSQERMKEAGAMTAVVGGTGRGGGTSQGGPPGSVASGVGARKVPLGASTSSVSSLSSLTSLPTPMVPMQPIDSEYFSVQQYTTQLLQQETLQGLVETDTRLLREVRRLDHELQELVYHNYSKFISATDTIREMHSHVRDMMHRLSSLHDHVGIVDHTSKQVFAALQPHRKRVEETITSNRKLKKASFIQHLPQTMERLLKEEKYTECVQHWVMGDAFFQKHISTGDSTAGGEGRRMSYFTALSLSTPAQTSQQTTTITAASSTKDDSSNREQCRKSLTTDGLRTSPERYQKTQAVVSVLSSLRRACWKVGQQLYHRMEDVIATMPLDDPTAIEVIHGVVEHLRLLRATSLFVPVAPTAIAEASSSSLPSLGTSEMSTSQQYHFAPGKAFSSSSAGVTRGRAPTVGRRMVELDEGEKLFDSRHSPSPSRPETKQEEKKKKDDEEVSFEESIRRVLMRSVQSNFSRDLTTVQHSLRDVFLLYLPSIKSSSEAPDERRRHAPFSSPLSAVGTGSGGDPHRRGPPGTVTGSFFTWYDCSSFSSFTLSSSSSLSYAWIPALQDAICPLPLPQRHILLERLALREPLAHFKSACALLAANSSRIYGVLRLQGSGGEMREAASQGVPATGIRCSGEGSIGEGGAPLETGEESVSTHVAQHVQPALMNILEDLRFCFTSYLYTYFHALFMHLPPPPLCSPPGSLQHLGEPSSERGEGHHYQQQQGTLPSPTTPPLSEHRKGSAAPVSEGSCVSQTAISSSSSAAAFPSDVPEREQNEEGRGLGAIEEENALSLLYLLHYPAHVKRMISHVTEALFRHLRLMSSTLKELGDTYLNTPLRKYQSKGYATMVDQCVKDIVLSCATLLQAKTNEWRPPAIWPSSTLKNTEEAPMRLPEGDADVCVRCAEMPLDYYSSSSLVTLLLMMRTAALPPMPPLPSSATAPEHNSSPLPGNEERDEEEVGARSSDMPETANTEADQGIQATTPSTDDLIFPSLADMFPNPSTRQAVVVVAKSSSFFHFILLHLACASFLSTIRQQLENVVLTLSPGSPHEGMTSVTPTAFFSMDTLTRTHLLSQLSMATTTVTHRAILLEGQYSVARLAAALFHCPQEGKADSNPNRDGTARFPPSYSQGQTATPTRKSTSTAAHASSLLGCWEEDYVRQIYRRTVRHGVAAATATPSTEVERHGVPQNSVCTSTGPSRWIHPQFFSVVVVEWTILFRFLTHLPKLCVLSDPNPSPPPAVASTSVLPHYSSSSFPSAGNPGRGGPGGGLRGSISLDPHGSLPRPPTIGTLSSPPSYGGRPAGLPTRSPSSSPGVPSSGPTSGGATVMQPQHRSRRQKCMVSYVRQEISSLQHHIDAIFLQQTPLFDTTPVDGEPCTVLRSVVLYVLRSLVDRIRRIPKPPLASLTSGKDSPLFPSSCTYLHFDHLHLHCTFLLMMLVDPPFTIKKLPNGLALRSRGNLYAGGVPGSGAGGTSGSSQVFSSLPVALPLTTREWAWSGGGGNGWGDATIKLFQREIDELCIYAYDRQQGSTEERRAPMTPKELEGCIDASLELYAGELQCIAESK